MIILRRLDKQIRSLAVMRHLRQISSKNIIHEKTKHSSFLVNFQRLMRKSVLANLEFVTFWPPIAKPRIEGEVTKRRYMQLTDDGETETDYETELKLFYVSLSYPFVMTSVFQSYKDIKQVLREVYLQAFLAIHGQVGGHLPIYIYSCFVCCTQLQDPLDLCSWYWSLELLHRQMKWSRQF